MSGFARTLAAAAMLAATVTVAAPTVVETEPLPPAEQRTRFRLPAEFEIQLVAAEPTIQKPMNLAFDTRGRLWVTHSVEYPFAAPADAEPRDGLTVLEDFGPDGLARKATRFAEGLNIPIGVLPLPCTDPDGRGQAVIVWSIPHIWKLTDTDGDGRADQREVLYGPFAFDDTHGNQNSFRLAADGWVYANHGFRNHSRVKLRGEGTEVLHLKSGNGYRFRPDGSAIEQVSWGQVNPFGMDFDALDNRFNADCHSRPLTMLLRGGRYLSPFGLRNDDYDDGLGAAPETTTDGHGSTGIAGVAICDTDRMPPAYRGSVFVGNVVTNVIHRDVVEWRGSSPWVERPEEFLDCDDKWFRPVDLTLGPDGALYVADFYNCIIGHYEVDLKHPRRDRDRGRIWRVVWKGAGGHGGPPDLSRLAAAELATLLDAPTETLRRLAFDQLVERGPADATVPPTLPAAAGGEHRRARTLRILGRLGLLDEATIEAAAADESRLVRVHLVKAIECLPDRRPAHDATVRGLLADPDPFVRRSAAESLAARFSDGGLARPTLDALPELLAGLRTAAADDTQLSHALRMAIAASLRSAGPESLATLAVAEVDRAALLDIVAGLPGSTLAGYGLGLARISAGGRDGVPPGGLPRRPATMPAASIERVCRSVARYGDPMLVDEAAIFARDLCGDDADAAAAVLQAMLDGARESSRPIADGSGLAGWARWLLEAVSAMPTATRPTDMLAAARPTDMLAAARPTDATVRAAIAVAERLSVKEASGLAIATVRDPTRPIDLRREAAATALALDLDPAVEVLVARLADPGEPAAARVEFARQLAGVDLPQARDAIAAALATAPAAQQRELALATLTGRQFAEAMLVLVERGKVSARLLQDPQVARRVRDVGVADADGRIAALTSGLTSVDEGNRGLIERVAKQVASGSGSAEAGGAVFMKHCAACHRHAGVGSLVGPQLDGVGLRGPERLLEDILDPNRNVDEAFRTTVVLLADGRVVSGLELRDDGADAVFVDASGREFRVPRAEIEETTVTSLSPMPSNMADQIGEEALPDLVAYLRKSAAPPNPGPP